MFFVALSLFISAQLHVPRQKASVLPDYFGLGNGSDHFPEAGLMPARNSLAHGFGIYLHRDGTTYKGAAGEEVSRPGICGRTRVGLIAAFRCAGTEIAVATFGRSG